MDILVNPDRSLWPGICERPSETDPEVEARVAGIIARVRDGGDRELRSISTEIDGVCPPVLEIGADEIAEAAELVSDALKEAIARAAANVRAFHSAQKPSEICVETAPGVRCIQRPVPLSRVGLYIPGGTAPLFSTVLMLAVPARLAGCGELILCTPCGKDGRVSPAVLYAADYCGVDRIFRIGGAQAIAAMAYGTESVPAVDKIFGPGNRYVTAAKQYVSSRKVAVDMPAGPSEVMVLADSTAVPAFVAADLLSQAEHGRDSQVMLVCDDPAVAESVIAEVRSRSALLERSGFVDASLSKSRCVVLPDRGSIVDFANAYAPEHLIVSMSDPWDIVGSITTAGSVFVGNYTPESAGDYASGTNHTLPTCGWARSFSGVNIDSFLRKMTIQEISREGLGELGPVIVEMAEAEGLQAHADAVRVRLASASASPDPAAASLSTASASLADGESVTALRKASELEDLVRQNIRSLCPYSTARDEFQGSIGIFLDANESPYPSAYNRYPDPHQKALKAKIAVMKGVAAENVFLGNGSDEAIDLVLRVFCNPGVDNVVSIEPSYGMYSVSAATNGIELRSCPLADDFGLDTEKLLSCCDARTKVIFLCSPNNPSGNAFPVEQLLGIASRFRGIVVVDEAYADFSSEPSLVGRFAEYPNIVVLQTFSKAWGMAGLRLGLAFADEYVIRLMSMVKYPYNINVLAQETVLKALDEPVADKVSAIIAQRTLLEARLAEFHFVEKVYPSEANFLLVKVRDADDLYSFLLERGIIVRNRNRVRGCEGCLRITVGLPQENVSLLDALSEYSTL